MKKARKSKKFPCKAKILKGRLVNPSSDGGEKQVHRAQKELIGR
jgi:hypothetical protein